jgi:hypothetical protein
MRFNISLGRGENFTSRQFVVIDFSLLMEVHLRNPLYYCRIFVMLATENVLISLNPDWSKTQNQRK